VTDPLPAPPARFVAGPDPDADPDLAEVVWFEIDGLTVGLRPIHPEDKSELLEGFTGMSEQSRYQRFLAPTDRLTSRQVAYLTELDQVSHFAWVAGHLDDGELHGLGVARYVRGSGDPDDTELAVAVTDEAQGRGLGTLLVEALVAVAAARGIPTIFGLVLAENDAMIRIFKAIGAEFTRENGNVVRATARLPARTRLTPDAVECLVRVADRAAREARSAPPDRRDEAGGGGGGR
jgi:acetyltransferase